MNTAYLKNKLEEEKATLEAEMGNIGRKNPVVPGDWEPLPPETGTESDLADQADITMTGANSSAIFADLEARYDTVCAALLRIEKGTYGVCEVCGGTIEEARLSANSAATTCVKHL
ncbi:MAG: TraR/DksA C4-type zinc finger protein [Minisyncoccia bacterium]